MITYKIIHNVSEIHFTIPASHEAYKLMASDIGPLVGELATFRPVKRTENSNTVMFKALSFSDIVEGALVEFSNDVINALNKLSQPQPPEINCHDHCEVCGKLEGQCTC